MHTLAHELGVDIKVADVHLANDTAASVPIHLHDARGFAKGEIAQRLLGFGAVGLATFRGINLREADPQLLGVDE